MQSRDCSGSSFETLLSQYWAALLLPHGRCVIEPGSTMSSGAQLTGRSTIFTFGAQLLESPLDAAPHRCCASCCTTSDERACAACASSVACCSLSVVLMAVRTASVASA